jgi:branched-chain amino acid transport system substrate-binding protein
MKTLVFVALAFGILITFGLLGPCPAIAQETLLIGQAVPLSGPAASWGVGQMRFLEMLEEGINAKGGLNIGGKRYLVKHVSYDHKVDLDTTIKVTNKLVFEHKVKFMFGCAVGATCRAAQTVTAPNNVMFSFSCWGKELLTKDVPLNFRAEHSTWEVCDIYYLGMKKRFPNLKKLATISPNDTSGWDGAKGAIAAAKKAGIDCVAEEYYERAQEDFHGVLGRILAKKPDIIDLATSPMGTGGLILKQLHELGYRGLKAWVAGTMPPAAIKVCGPEAAEDLYNEMYWDFSGKYTTPELRALEKEYERRYKEPVDYVTVGQYCFMKAAFTSMEKAQTLDPVKLADAIVAGAPYNSVLGPYMFGMADFYKGKPRQALHPMVLSAIKGGKVVNLGYELHEELKAKVGDWKFPE